MLTKEKCLPHPRIQQLGHLRMPGFKDFIFQDEKFKSHIMYIIDKVSKNMKNRTKIKKDRNRWVKLTYPNTPLRKNTLCVSTFPET